MSRLSRAKTGSSPHYSGKVRSTVKSKAPSKALHRGGSADGATKGGSSSHGY